MEMNIYHVHYREVCFEIMATCAEVAVRRVAEWLTIHCHHNVDSLRAYSAFTVEYNTLTKVACSVSFRHGRVRYEATPITDNVWTIEAV